MVKIKRNEEYSRIIGMVRIPLILSLVFLHFDISQNGNIDIILNTYDVSMPLFASIPIFITGHLFAGVAIGCFFIISGYLFFLTYQATYEGYIVKMKSRFYSLFVPFILWNIVFSIYAVFSAIIRYRITGEILFFGKPIPSLLNLIYDALWVRPACGSMWYVRELMILVLLSPVVCSLISCRYWKWILVLAGCLCLMPYLYRYQLTQGGLRGLFLFMLGGAISVRGIDCLMYLKSVFIIPVFLIVAAIDILLKFFLISEYYHWYHNITMIAAILAIFHIGVRFSEIKYPRMIDSSFLFFLFASHELFIGPCCKFYSILLDPISWERQVVLWLLTILSVFILSYSGNQLTKTITPHIYQMMTGYRKNK